MKKILILYTWLFFGFPIVACAQQTPSQAVEENEPMAPVTIPSLPHQLNFAGEKVPFEYFDVRENLTREMLVTCYMHSRTIQTLLATTRYFPVIESILRRNGVPEDFKYLCMAESGLNPNVRSTAGAVGLWQFMQNAGTKYGLFISTNNQIDERYHIEKATEAACKYIIDAKNKLGSWTLAAAAYNAGLDGVQTRMQQQGISNYYDLVLPEETMKYVFRILSFKLITPNPSAYGFLIAPADYYKPLEDYHETQVCAASIDWSALAKENGTNYKVLRDLNPWIRDCTYNNTAGRTFTVKIPNKNFRKK